MESARTTILSTTMLYKVDNISYSLRLVESEGKDGSIYHKFGILEHRYENEKCRWIPVRSRAFMPVSVWSTLAAHGQRIIGSLPSREPTKHDQATETSARDTSDAAHSEIPSSTTERHEPQPTRVAKVLRVAREPPCPVGKSTGKPRGRPRKRPASPAAKPPAKRVDTDHVAQP